MCHCLAIVNETTHQFYTSQIVTDDELPNRSHWDNDPFNQKQMALTTGIESQRHIRRVSSQDYSCLSCTGRSLPTSSLILSLSLSPPRATISFRHTHRLPHFKCTLPVSEKPRRALLIFSKAFIIDSLRDKLLKIISYSQTLFVFIEKPRVLRASGCQSHYLWS